MLSLVTGAQWISRDKTIETLHHATPQMLRARDAGEHEATGEAAHRGGGEEAASEGHAAEGGEEEARHQARARCCTKTTWFEIGGSHGIKIKAGVLIDGLSVALLVVVSTISLLVHIFSTEYLRDDRRKTHYFAALSLFTSGMFILVTSSNTLQMIFGWELMGLCSFMLIGHWWEDKDNSNAALKAFFTTRTGDIGLLVGVSMLFGIAGSTFDIGHINNLALGGSSTRACSPWRPARCCSPSSARARSSRCTPGCPTPWPAPRPVSALIHAATMVVAGVFLIARLYGVFWQGFHIGAGDGYTPVAMVGGVTMIIAAAARVRADATSRRCWRIPRSASSATW